MQFRRPWMAVTHNLWRGISEELHPRARRDFAEEELLCLMASLPQLMIDFRIPTVSLVTCSDASETGAGGAKEVRGSLLARCCVVRTCDAARAEGRTRDGDARPLATTWECSLRHKCAVDWVHFFVAVDERVLFAHKGERVGLEARRREVLRRWAEPIRVLPSTPGVTSRLGRLARADQKGPRTATDSRD